MRPTKEGAVGVLAILVVAAGMWLTALGAVASYSNSMFWPYQVIAKWGQPGIAFATHGGMWSDFFILAPFCGWIVYRFGDRWGDEAELFGYQPDISIIILAAIIGFLLAAGNHIQLCVNQKIPDPQGWQKEWWSATIADHFVYFWGAATILVAMCLTKGLDSTTVALIAIFVGIHMTFGIHIPLGIVNRFVRSDLLPEFLRPDAFGLEVGLWIAMAGVAWYAGGLRAVGPVVIVGLLWLIATGLVMTLTNPLEPATG